MGRKPPATQPMTGEQIRAMTVGELRPHAGPVELVEYDARWPGLFRREDRRIRAALGESAHADAKSSVVEEIIARST